MGTETLSKLVTVESWIEVVIHDPVRGGSAPAGYYPTMAQARAAGHTGMYESLPTYHHIRTIKIGPYRYKLVKIKKGARA
jgi:hypothetical protein